MSGQGRGLDFGWSEHVNKVGTPCAYCGEVSTHTLVLEPDQTKNHEVVKRGIRVGVCDAHRRQAEPPVGNFRAKRAKGVEQLAMDIDAAKRRAA